MLLSDEASDLSCYPLHSRRASPVFKTNSFLLWRSHHSLITCIVLFMSNTILLIWRPKNVALKLSYSICDSSLSRTCYSSSLVLFNNHYGGFLLLAGVSAMPTNEWYFEFYVCLFYSMCLLAREIFQISGIFLCTEQYQRRETRSIDG